jgi:hypothetical protein
MRKPIKGFVLHAMEDGRYQRLLSVDYPHYIYKFKTTSNNPELHYAPQSES